MTHQHLLIDQILGRLYYFRKRTIREAWGGQLLGMEQNFRGSRKTSEEGNTEARRSQR